RSQGQPRWRSTLHCPRSAPPRPSSPTRRSSDLALLGIAEGTEPAAGATTGTLTSNEVPLERIQQNPFQGDLVRGQGAGGGAGGGDRKSTRLNSSHLGISYAVFCLKKKKKRHQST